MQRKRGGRFGHLARNRSPVGLTTAADTLPWGLELGTDGSPHTDTAHMDQPPCLPRQAPQLLSHAPRGSQRRRFKARLSHAMMNRGILVQAVTPAVVGPNPHTPPSPLSHSKHSLLICCSISILGGSDRECGSISELPSYVQIPDLLCGRGPSLLAQEGSSAF